MLQNDIAISVKGRRKSFMKLHVLKGVDFEVEKGTVFALPGSNGAGKTTIVKILAMAGWQNYPCVVCCQQIKKRLLD
ncbi:MAG: hypothetical protein A2W85_05280 [Bacteroidetes bacterium GWF2_41_31]|nr:MAG: hypothetical protein A2W85_05280 [Bacteroidetes bacterium GWF2_41_31]